MTVRYMSVCSGIEAASVAWNPLGWTATSVAEIDPFASAVLAARWPGVPNLGDMTKFKDWPDAAIDLLVGGTPCQSFSVAGLRAGLADPRGNLALVYLAVADRYRPRWVLWENVPGVLSIDGGCAFGSILGGLAKLGYGWAYRILDAQYVRVDGLGRAVPQRRRRVFVVGCLGGWRRAAAVLFDAASLHGDPAPRREAGKDVARPIASSSHRGSGYRNDADTAENLIVAGTLGSNGKAAGSATLQDACADQPALRARPNNSVAVAFAENTRDEIRLVGGDGQVCGPLITGGGKAGRSYPAIATAYAVRRLTPRECERLQGFSDGHTNVQYRGKPAADGPRYRVLGNSMAVNAMRWIGRRIQMVEALP